ncbi:hypothetical protein D9611_002162 [Ephemerocybe angulata]|uniref:Uncharacterized protein n=1 Tax=Ephemerocybe angulata TaxID=980116 RepID=A0A8H5FM29_9AGAR|nr:hypothetical protein D9611_002162 [Tulosesus angulatus]
MRAASFIFASVALFASAVSAAPADVFVPHITAPIAGAVWKIGSTQEVTWDTSNAPGQISNPEGNIFLRDVTQGITLLDSPLATGFNILEGKQAVHVPNVAAGPYEIVLFGDSGNFSPTFQIIV